MNLTMVLIGGIYLAGIYLGFERMVLGNDALLSGCAYYNNCGIVNSFPNIYIYAKIIAMCFTAMPMYILFKVLSEVEMMKK